MRRLVTPRLFWSAEDFNALKNNKQPLKHEAFLRQQLNSQILLAPLGTLDIFTPSILKQLDDTFLKSFSTESTSSHNHQLAKWFMTSDPEYITAFAKYVVGVTAVFDLLPAPDMIHQRQIQQIVANCQVLFAPANNIEYLCPLPTRSFLLWLHDILTPIDSALEEVIAFSFFFLVSQTTPFLNISAYRMHSICAFPFPVCTGILPFYLFIFCVSNALDTRFPLPCMHWHLTFLFIY
jgi:hypothetical protein